jgi:hypothetical protein
VLNSVTGCQSRVTLVTSLLNCIAPRRQVKREVAKLLAILGEPDFVLASELELIARKR